MFGLLFSCLKWACQKLGWVNYFKIVAGALAFVLGPWTGTYYISFGCRSTVTGSPSCSFARQVALSNLCHFSTEMAEIWSPGTFFADIWTYKISALYLLYFQSYLTFIDVLSDFH